MATAIVLYGPKAVGKSWVAEVLRTHLGVAHVDPDELVGDLLVAGTRPDPVDGWLTFVRRRVPVPAEEASWIYDQATARAAGRRLDARIDTGRPPDPAAVVAELRPLIQP